MSSDNRHSIARYLAAFIVIGITIAYVVQIVRGRVVGEHRLGTNDTILVGLALFVCVLLLHPEIVKRLSSIELLGIKLQLEKVKEKQEAQEHELQSIKLLMPLLLPEKEHAHLRNLASGKCTEYKGAEIVRSELRHLRSMDLIQRKGHHTISELRDGLIFDLAKYVELTESGREWLQRLSEMDSAQ